MKTIFLLFFGAISQVILSQVITYEVQLTSDIKLFGTAKKFIASEHQIDTCDTGLGWLNICKIDGNPWFGCDAGLDLPDFELSSLTFKIGEKSIELKVTQMYNPAYIGKLQKDQFNLIKTMDGYLLDGFFSDGAGTYVAKWEIKNGKSRRIILSKDESDFWMM